MLKNVMVFVWLFCFLLPCSAWAEGLKVGTVDGALLAIFHPYFHAFNPHYRALLRESFPWAEKLDALRQKTGEEYAEEIRVLQDEQEKLKNHEKQMIDRQNDELSSNTRDFSGRISKAASSDDPTESYKVREEYRIASESIEKKYNEGLEEVRKKIIDNTKKLVELRAKISMTGDDDFLSFEEMKVVIVKVENEIIDAVNKEAQSQSIDFIVNTGFKIPLKYLSGIPRIPFRFPPITNADRPPKDEYEEMEKVAKLLLHKFELLQMISLLGDRIGGSIFQVNKDIQQVDLTQAVLVRILQEHNANAELIEGIKDSLSKILMAQKTWQKN